MIRFEALNQQELVDLCTYFMGERDRLAGELTAEKEARQKAEANDQRTAEVLAQTHAALTKACAARALCAEAAEAIRERCICDECGYHDAPVCDGCILAAQLDQVARG